jgi:hypothetical protein
MILWQSNYLFISGSKVENTMDELNYSFQTISYAIQIIKIGLAKNVNPPGGSSWAFFWFAS